MAATIRTRVGAVVLRLARSLLWRERTLHRLRQDNKRLRMELRRRPPQVALDGPRPHDEEGMIVERFHMLYRDDLRLDKRTWWRGVRVIKCPLDLWIYQELIFELTPDLIIETGTMYGGSALYLGSILDLAGHGEVLSIDIHHREGRPQHPRVSYLTGSSTDSRIVGQASERAAGKRTVIVVLDSNHDAPHVLEEMHAYHRLVTPGSYLIVEDTNINGHPVEVRFGPGPMEAVDLFLRRHDDFEIDRSREKFLLTFNPRGWLRKKNPVGIPHG